MRDAHLAARLYGTPLMIHPHKAAAIEAVFRSHMLREPPPAISAELEAKHPTVESAHPGVKWRPRDGRPFAFTESGIAVIQVLGTLVHRGMAFDALSGIESYTAIDTRLSAALEAGDVRAILFEWDTWGGEVFGCGELALRIAEAAKIKPIWGAINECCYSAGYYLASSVSRLYLPRSAETANIGTLALHVDQSKFDLATGFTYTYIYDGDHKADLNPHEPLGDGPRDRLQALVTRHGLMFREHVAEMRDLELEVVTATKADALAADAAVDGGFADGIANFAETVGMIEEELGGTFRTTGSRTAGRSFNPEKETVMSDPKQPAAAQPGAADQPKHTDAQLNAAVEAARTAARAEGVTEGTAAGTTAGIKAERDRVRSILTHAEAANRGKLAMSMALESDLTPEQAGKQLAAAAKEQGNGLSAMMAGLKNPTVGVDTDAGGEESTTAVTSIVGLMSRNGGRVAKQG